MTRPTHIIFDLDGTLYPFSATEHRTFSQTAFYVDLCERVIQFVATEFGIDRAAAQQMLANVNEQCNGELSIGFERLYGIDRNRYFAATWGCDPAEYIPAPTSSRLADELRALTGRSLLLTQAPRIWAERALTHLGLAEVFGDRILTGEPDIRKPDVRIFQQAAKHMGVKPEQVMSVGDQHHTDIAPAQALGMTTLLIGPEQLGADHRADTIHDAIRIIKENIL